jgi:hypothetical protein
MARESHDTATSAAAVPALPGCSVPGLVDLIMTSGRPRRGTRAVVLAGRLSAPARRRRSYSTIRKICHWLVPETT